MDYDQKMGRFLCCLVIFMSLGMRVYGCTDFVVQAKNGTLVNGRSLEFAMDLQTKIKVFPRKLSFSSQAPGKKKGIDWTSKYGYLGAAVFDSNLTIDGLNEEGLSFGFLWLPGTQYMESSSNGSKKALDFADFGSWVLGNFSSVSELKKALSEVFVWGHPVPPLSGIPPVHVAIHDRFGHHLVIEFIKGEMKVYDNPNTVLTNYPPFDWHLINLQNYIGLKALNASAVEWEGKTFTGSGQGSGFLGMPGDWTPPSRFIRTTALLRFADPVDDSMEAVNLAEHLLNAVDIPLGDIKASSGEKDYTQWIVIKDLTNRAFYFRSYKDLSLKWIDLKKVDFAPNAPQITVSIDIQRGYLEVISQ